MKTISQNKSLFLISCIALLFSAFQNAEARPEEARPGEVQAGMNISFETFYHELAPHGRWINDRNFGNVWLPDVPRNFRPYMTEGHWVMTEYGNTWVSNYSWGWAPFHYGRWHLDDYYGWIWVPGTEWGPAWVAWRSGGGYYGWAPLGPRVNINISVNIGRYIPDAHWAFVRYGHFTHPRMHRYYAPSSRVTNIIHHTTIINNTYVDNGRHTYYTGPRANDIERTTKKRVQVHTVRHTDRPGTTVVRNGAVNVYQPSVRSGRSNSTANSATRSRSNVTSQDNRSNVSRYHADPAPRTRVSDTESRQKNEVRSSRSYPTTTPTSRSSADHNSRNNRTYESSRESRTYRSNSGNRPNTNTQVQRSSRSNSSQQYSNDTKQNATSRSRSNGSVERSSTKSSGQSTRSVREKSTQQRTQRASPSAEKARSSQSTERSTQGRSSRSSRSGNN